MHVNVLDFMFHLLIELAGSLRAEEPVQSNRRREDSVDGYG
jgi:hypothetical protein